MLNPRSTGGFLAGQIQSANFQMIETARLRRLLEKWARLCGGGVRLWSRMTAAASVAANLGYSLIWDQVIGCLSTSTGFMRVTRQEPSGCLAKKISPLKKRNDL